VSEINQDHELWRTLTHWICECADESCTERVAMTGEEYAAVRDSGRFAVAPSGEHVIPAVERIVEMHPRYWVVEKLGRRSA
jgi:hypothetical protein